MKKNSLAYYGGKKVIDKKLSYRKLFGKEELKKVEEVFRYSWKIKKDFGFQEIFEDKFTKSFSKFMGGGYTDGVSSGGAALYIALKALNISTLSSDDFESLASTLKENIDSSLERAKKGDLGRKTGKGFYTYK